jgi:hypothetical protein
MTKNETLTAKGWVGLGNEKNTADSYQEQPTQEPVACMFVSEEGGCEEIGHLKYHYDGKFPDDFTPLYTHPHQWQGLTDDEIWDIANYLGKNKEWDYPIMFAKTLQKVLMEKNHG